MAKKKRSAFVRTTISLPAELRKRMKACGDGVNWSAIAAEAFAAEVARINTRKDDSKMDDVIERLRASQRESGTQSFEEGREAGMEWAKRFAEAAELQRLWREWEIWSRERCNRTDWMTFGGDQRGKPRDTLVEITSPVEFKEDPRRVVDEFWTYALSEEFASQSEEAEFVHGFADGALDVWAEVADKL